VISEDQQVKTPQEEIKATDRHQREERTSPAKSEPISQQENIQQLTAKNVRELDPISHTKPLYQQIGERYYQDSYAASQASFDENKSYTSESSYGFIPEQPKIIPKFK